MMVVGWGGVGWGVELFVGKVCNGFDYWFTFVLVEGLVSTNNGVEITLREVVV
jgi:hypothetical protein